MAKTKTTNVVDEHKLIEDVREHVLLRPSQWIGSPKTVTSVLSILENGVFVEKEMSTNQGLAKIIEEIIVNSADEHVRTKENPKLRGWVLNKIDVKVGIDGKVVIRDNGGISSLIHESGKPRIEVLFGNLFSSSNYNDNQKRKTAGTHGVGGSLTNVFSKRFRVTTCDAKFKNVMEWSNNMFKNTPLKTTPIKEHYTEISFDIDLERFGCKEIPYGVMKYVERLCISLASVNVGLEVTFNDTKYKFSEFKEFVKLFGSDRIISDKVKDFEVHIVPTLGLQEPRVFGIVNGSECHKGTHINNVRKLVNTAIKEKMDKEKAPSLTSQQISSGYHLYICASVENPMYTAQNKDELGTETKNMYPKLAPKFEKTLVDSEILTYLTKLSKEKNNVLQSKELSKIVKDATAKGTKSIVKLIDATETDKKIRKEKCEMWIFEGNSAGSGFRPNRIQKLQGAYLLKGKMKNTATMSILDTMKNDEIRELTIAFGLNPKKPDDFSELRYRDMIFCTDMDWDGYAISCLGITWLATHYPRMIEEGRVFRAITPLYRVEKNKDVKYFYNHEDYDKFMAKNKGYDSHYFKGIGSLLPSDFKTILREHTILEQITIDDLGYEMIDIFIRKDDERKKQKLKDILKNS